MIQKEDMREAFATQKIIDLNKAGIKDLLIESITEYAARKGESNIKKVFIDGTADLFADDLIKYYKHLPIGEVLLSIKLLGFGELVEESKHSCVMTFKTGLDVYLASLERRDFKEELESKLLPQKTQPSEYELKYMMSIAWGKVCQAERDKTLYNDTGNVLFDYMESLGKIRLEDCDIEESVEYHQYFMNLPDHAAIGTAGVQKDLSKEGIRMHQAGDNKYMLPMAKKFALRRARQEQLMEIEARKIKQS